IKSYDEDGRVIYCGSFSKVIAPALRVGFMNVNKGLIPRLITGKQCTDIHTVPLTQHICHEFLTNYDYDGHIAKIVALYSEKCALMLSEIEKQFPEYIRYTKPQGGMFVMFYLPEGLNSEPFVREAIKRGVACIPGSTLIPQYGISNAVRLNFSTPTKEEIIKGIGILAQLIKEYCL
ncbi:MAG: PLP-dependent aminotransferase family protein, partial [Clostridia bacterium]|nr:PLP-dependent aminotransferase family protein [Clostridia bacterium]